MPAPEVARLTKLRGTGSDVLRGFGIGLRGLSALGFFVALLGASRRGQSRWLCSARLVMDAIDDARLLKIMVPGRTADRRRA